VLQAEYSLVFQIVKSDAQKLSHSCFLIANNKSALL